MGNHTGAEIPLRRLTQTTKANAEQEDPDAPIFLSEFPKLVQPFLKKKGWSIWLAAFFLAGLGFILTAGHLAGSNFIHLVFTPQITLVGKSVRDATPLNFEYGYLVELSHALFFLILAPSFIILSELFLKRIEEAVAILHRTGRLTVSKGAIRKFNQKLFRPLIWVFPTAFVV